MLSLTRKTDYALVAMAELAGFGTERASARHISERTHVPLPVLTNILHRLGIAGLVRSHMGAKGGYWLSKAPSETNMTEIIEAIEGPFRLTICSNDGGVSSDEQGCDLEADCRIKIPVQRLQQKMREFLCEVTLESMLNGDGLIGIGLGSLVRPARRAAVESGRIEKGCLHTGAGGME